MQQIINRKLYDTDKAEQIATHAPLTDKGNFHYLIETLYKTTDGEYFLHGDGGAATKWAEKIGRQRTPGEELQLLTDEEALDWCQENAIDTEILIKAFGHLIET